MNRPSIPKTLRYQVIERDRVFISCTGGYEHYCAICKGAVAKKDITLDHVIPYAVVKEHKLDNLQIAHTRCNSMKGAGNESQAD